MNKKVDHHTRWEVICQEDPETGDLLLPIPQELLDKMGWVEGDTLNWHQEKGGSWVLVKEVPGEQQAPISEPPAVDSL